MTQRVLIPRRPIRAAILTGAALSLLGCLAVFVPGVTASPLIVIAAALAYGTFLGWFAVGLSLASRRPASRWWWASAALPLAALAIVAMLARQPEAILHGLPII